MKLQRKEQGKKPKVTKKGGNDARSMLSVEHWKELIPEHFYRGNLKPPTAQTVEQLIEILQQLPPTLKVRTDMDTLAKVVVYNINDSTRYVTLEE